MRADPPESPPAPARVLRIAATAAIALVALVGIYVATATGDHSADRHEKMRLLANFNDGGEYRVGTDLAFWGNTMIAGNLDQGTGPNASPPGGFRVIDISRPSDPAEVGQYVCSGDQSDVSVWKDIVVTSIDKPTQELCTAEETAAAGADAVWEGLRVVSIADPSDPEILATVRTRCGSHTNTAYPDLENRRLLVYVLSYPLAGRYNPAGEQVPLAAGGPGCNAADHGVISVVEVPLSDPGNSTLLGTVDVSASPVAGLPDAVKNPIGCHDVSLFLERDLAAAACLTESQIWDLSDPAEPEVVARIPNPAGMDISHSATFSNDGKTLVLGAELGGAAASPGCLSASSDDPIGGLFFYDIAGAKRQAPEFLDSFKLPQQVLTSFCTAHQFNTVPRRDETDVLVSSWYTGATSVIDYTGVRDGAKPEQIAFYIPSDFALPPEPGAETVGEAAAWASYWYRGKVYSSNFDEDVSSVSPNSRGLDVFAVDHRAVRGAIRLRRLNPQVQEPLPGRRAARRD